MSEQAPDNSGSSPRLSPKKLIIIIAAALLLLIAGGVGSFFILKSQMAAQPAHEEEQANHKKEGAPALFYDMSKPFIVDFPKSETIKLIQIAFTFAVADEETAGALKKNEPMLRNNLIMIISAQNPDQLNTTEGKEKLRAAILADLTATLEKLKVHGEVNEVLFTSFIMQ